MLSSGFSLRLSWRKIVQATVCIFRVIFRVPKFSWFFEVYRKIKKFQILQCLQTKNSFFDQIFWNIKKYNQDQAGRAGVAYPSYYSPTTAGTSSPNGTSTVGPTANQLTPPSASAMSHTTGQIDTQAGNHYHASYTQYWANQVSKLNMIEVHEQSWKNGISRNKLEARNVNVSAINL